MEYTKEYIETLINRYLSATLTDDEETVLRQWLSVPENRSEFQQLVNIWQTLNPPFDPDGIDVVNAHGKVLHQIKPERKTRPNWLIYWQRAAAILILPLIGFCGYLLVINQETVPEEVITYQEVISPYGSRSRVELPDGSNVWLNAGSTLRYPTTFIRGERIVELSGEAFFEVESDKDKPFIVSTPSLEVHAVGTSFNVDAYEEDSLCYVTMVSGLVNIALGNSMIPLHPGERFQYNKQTSNHNLQWTDPYKYYAWKDGILVFRDDPLDYVFKKIGQTFNIDIVLKDESIAKHLYRATFERESLDEILRLLQMTAPISYNTSGREMNSNGIYKKHYIEVYSMR